jgi:hypothetical protein
MSKIKNSPPPDDDMPTTVTLKLNPKELGDSYKDLEANAQLKGKTPKTLLADIVAKALGGTFTVRTV